MRAKERHEIYTCAINFWGARPNFMMASQRNRPESVKCHIIKRICYSHVIFYKNIIA